MPDLKWSKLTGMQLGRYAEYYAKMEFTSYKYEVYTSEVDDHGVDFVAKYNGKFYEVQVKSVRQDGYLYIPQKKVTVSDNFLICYMRFTDDKLPDVFVFPATVWNYPNALFVNRPYGQEYKSDPEFGINYNKKNAPLLEKYKAESFFKAS